MLAKNLFGEIAAWTVIGIASLSMVYVVYTQIQLRKIDQWVSDIPNQIRLQKQEWNRLGK